MATVTKPPILDDTGQDILTALNRIADAREAKIVSYGGSLTFAYLPNPTSANLNTFYLITDSFTTNSNFVEGPGISEAGGQYWIVVDIGTSLSPNYKYDTLGSLIDLSTKQDVILATPLTIGGVTRSTVEDALGALNDRVFTISESFTADAGFVNINISTLNIATNTYMFKFHSTIHGMAVKTTSYDGLSGILTIYFKHKAPSSGTFYVEVRRIS